MNEDDGVEGYLVDGDIGGADLFARTNLAAGEGPPEAWELAKTVVDHACYLFVVANEVRADKVIRDSALAALLRRATITAEGIRVLLEHGLEEPAYGLMRMLLELEATVETVVSDPTNRMAKRLAAFHFLSGKRHMHRILGNPDERKSLRATPDGRFEWTVSAVRRLDSFFESSGFDEVREELKRDQHWHGKKSIEEMYTELGRASDYLNLYSIFSPFVHSSNVDHDFAGLNEGRPAVKAFVQRDPRRTLSLIEGMMLMLVSIMDMYIEDKKPASYPDSIRVVTESTGDIEMVKPTTLLKFQIFDLFSWVNVPPPMTGTDVDTADLAPA